MNYIKQYKNNLSSDFCKKVIEKFELDENKESGIVGSGYRPELKQSTDLNISNLNNIDKWKTEDEYFFKSLEEPIRYYIKEFYVDKCNGTLENPFDVGYQIQRTNSDQIGYGWHNDFYFHYEKENITKTRIATYLWYLNDVEEGGETEFMDGTMVVPETGKLIIFPATWTYAHRGHPPKKGKKYICTGWYHTDIRVLIF
jgi:hypothetical protein